MNKKKVVSVESVGVLPVFDISVKDAEHYILENGAITHNTGGYYSANDIWIIGRSQEKDGTDITGYTFTINIEKSRRVKEKSKIPLTVMFDGGITRWSGLLELALEYGAVVKPKMGWYQKVDMSTGEMLEGSYRAKDTNKESFWDSILKDPGFEEFIQKKYRLVMDDTMISTDEEEEDVTYADEE